MPYILSSNALCSLEEVLNFLSLAKKFISCLLDLGNGVFVVKLETLDNLVLAVGCGDGEGEDKALRDAVGLAV